MGNVWAIVVAGGGGRRFGGPKQFEDLHGRRVLDWSVAAARAGCDGVVAVVPADRLDEEAQACAGGFGSVVAGGSTRSESVRAGLAAVPDDAEIVVVHDAARPVAGVELFHRTVAAVRAGADAAIPGVPVADTVKRVSDGRVVETVDRSHLVAVQTPQAFRAEILRRAHADDPEATDDAALVEALGGLVVVVDGDPRNLKLTSPWDLLVARGLLGGAR